MAVLHGRAKDGLSECVCDGCAGFDWAVINAAAGGRW